MTMLDLDQVNLGELCMALEDNSPEHSWWLDPASGGLRFWTESGDTFEEEHPDERGLVYVDPVDSAESYSDMEQFAEAVPDPPARDLLLRAIAGRGAFRRFKDTLLEFPDIREAWFHFHDARMERRAIAWLADRGLIHAGVAENAVAARMEPPFVESHAPIDAMLVAREVTRDLRDLYGARLKTVVLFGSWARGDAHHESDIDLLVVLDEVRSRRVELNRMSDVLWRHSLRHGTVVTELPVSEAEYRESDKPILVRARAEGSPVA
jgi:predicted nucleotidyltransferase